MFIARSMEGVHIVSLKKESHLCMSIAETFHFDYEPHHIATSTVIPYHAAITLKYGQIVIWDAKYNGKNIMTN